MSAPDAGLTEKTTGLAGYYQEGDYVVPRYTELGHKIKGGRVYGDKDEVMRKAQSIAENAMRNKAELLPVPAKVTKATKSTKKAATPTKTVIPTLKIDGFSQDNTPIDPPTPTAYNEVSQAEEALPSLDVVFRNAFGKIKVTVIAAQVDERSVCLIFKDEVELRFEPEIGDKFTIIIGNEAYDVFYPGFLFTWIDNKKKIMVLGRDLKDNNEN